LSWKLCFLYFCVTLLKKRRYIGIALSSCLSIHPSIGPKNLALAITSSFLVKLENYIADDIMDTMISNSLGQGHTCRSFAPFLLTSYCYSDKASKSNTSVHLNTPIVVQEWQLSRKCVLIILNYFIRGHRRVHFK